MEHAKSETKKTLTPVDTPELSGVSSQETHSHGAASFVATPGVIPAQAGSLSRAQLTEINGPTDGIDNACDDAVEAIERMGGEFTMPPDVTVEQLSVAADRVEEAEQIVADIEVVYEKAKQAVAIRRYEAYLLARKVNRQVQAQGQFNKKVLSAFAQFLAYFRRKRRKPVEPKS